MKLLILELVWWVVLFLFFWALRDARSRISEEIESLALANGPTGTKGRIGGSVFQQAHAVREPIGSYQGLPIHRYAEVEGRMYQFDRVCPPDIADTLAADEIYLAPGIVYRPMDGTAAADAPA